MLQLSEERFKALITVLEEGDKAFVGDIQRDAVAQAQADIFFQLGLRDKDLMKWGFNQIGIMKGQYHTAVLDIVSKFQAGTYSSDKAFNLWKDVSKRTVEGMYRAGAATVGNPFYKELKIPGRDLRLMSKYMRREGKFFKGLLSDIKDPRHVPTIPTDAAGKRLPGYRLQKFDYLTRAGMYPESLDAMRWNGQLMGAGRNIEIRWVLGVPMTEHCIDCPALAMRVWLPETLPTVPRAGDTKCLWKCYCHLEPRQRFMRTTFDIAGRATEGAIRAFGRNARVYDTAGHEIGGQLQREIEYWQAQEYKARQMMSTVPKSERMFWIGERKRFNRLIIDRAKAGSYRVVPTVSVSSLTKTIQAAARKGGTLTAIEKLMVGDEVWFVRSDYSSFGVVGIRNGVKVFKSPTGVVLNFDGMTDIIFAAKRGAVVWKNMTKTELGIFARREGLNVRDLTQLSTAEANNAVRTLYDLKRKYKVFWEEIGFEPGHDGYANYGQVVIGADMGKSYTLGAAKSNYKYCMEELLELNPRNRPLSQITHPGLRKLIIANTERAKAFEKIIKSMESGKYNYYKDHSVWAFKSATEGALRHELGHVLAYKFEIAIKRFFPWKKGMGTVGKWVWRQKNYGITFRAMDNWAECLAENFTLYSVGKTQGMHRDMIKFFDYIFGGGT